MEIEFLRSSSINTWENYCQHKYFLIYNLGFHDKENFKTVKGTICHAALECLAGMKKSFQETNKYCFKHPALGLYECSENKFLEPLLFSNSDIDLINKSRSNKQIYVDQIKVEYGHVRYGVEIVEDVLNKCYNYYTSRFDHDWTKADKRDCLNWLWMVLDWGNGIFDPRKSNVIHPELPFNIEIKKDWAKISDNKYLRIKGTIDLVVEEDDGIIEVRDWKFGARYDWGKGKEKTYEDLMEDPQLQLYYYALRKALPQYNTIILTIIFARNGGGFSLPFDDSILEKVENNLKKTFEDIRDCKKPKLRDPSHKEFQCKTLCGFFKEKVENTCVCDYISKEIEVYGIEKTSLKHRKKDFEVGFYKNPGE